MELPPKRFSFSIRFIDMCVCFCLTVVSVTASVGFLALIAVDRFFAIVLPLKMGISRVTMAAIISAAWCGAIGVGIPQVIYRRRREIFWYNRHEVWCEEAWPRFQYLTDEGICLGDMSTRRTYYAIYTVLFYFIPILAISVIYVTITCKLWRRLPQKSHGAQVEAMHQKIRKRVRLEMDCFIHVRSPTFHSYPP